MKKIKIAFIYDRPLNYIGGYNYLYNLLIALSYFGISKKDLLIFCTKDISKKNILELEKYGTLIKSYYLTKWNIHWFINRLSLKFLNFSPYLFLSKRKHKFTHTYFSFWIGRKSFFLKQIYWLPDLQCFKFPEYFSKSFINKENLNIKKQLKNATAIVLSSNTIKNELIEKFNLNNKVIEKIKVLNFASAILQVDNSKNVKTVLHELVKKYQLMEGYFFCPNQFWPHKNHLQLVKAFYKIINENNDFKFKLILTGNKFFKKNNCYYYDEFKDFVDKFNMSEFIIHFENLDLIKIKAFYSGSLALINPSKYEGWSTTIEEARAYGLNLLISDIEVNREQNCQNVNYFNPNSISSISNSIEEFCNSRKYSYINNPLDIYELRNNTEFKTRAEKRLKDYGKDFFDICETIF